MLDATDKLLRQMKQKPSRPMGNWAPDFTVPNHSGDHSAGHTNTPTNSDSIPNKAYVDTVAPSGLTDDSMADSLHRHSELSANDGNPNAVFTLDPSGNVIHTATTYTLDSAGAAIMALDRAGTSNLVNFVVRTAGADEWSLGLKNDSSNDFHFWDSINSRTPLLIKQSTGNIGIGTLNPLVQLTLSSSAPTIRLDATTSGSNWQIEANSQAADMLVIRDVTNARNLMAFNQTGNTGIGTLTPTAALSVSGSQTIDNGNLVISTAATNTFTTVDGKTVTVSGGIVIGIV